MGTRKRIFGKFPNPTEGWWGIYHVYREHDKLTAPGRDTPSSPHKEEDPRKRSIGRFPTNPNWGYVW